MKEKCKVVCFDMDGTLIRNTNSVEYLCKLSGKANEAKIIEDMEMRKELNWIEADYQKAKLFKGLNVFEVGCEFEKNIEVIENLTNVLDTLRKRKVQVVLITAGPIQVAEEMNKRYKFNQIFGSDYEVKKGIFTGNIVNHLGNKGKLNSLKSYCKSINVSLDEVVSVGDSESDISIFEATGKSIALNYSDCLVGKAQEYIKTDDLRDILKFILDEV